MDLNTLRKKGGFVSDAPVKTSGSWTHYVTSDGAGEEITDEVEFYVIKPGFGVFERFLSARSENRAETSEMISLCIRLGADGKEQLSYEDAYSLDPALAQVFVEGIRKINGLDGQEKK